jgi:hypothetical protein
MLSYFPYNKIDYKKIKKSKLGFICKNNKKELTGLFNKANNNEFAQMINNLMAMPSIMETRLIYVLNI